MTDETASPDAADLLYGVRAIGDFLGLPKRAAQHRIDGKVIPTFRMGATICARRSTLTAWLAECERQAAAPAGLEVAEQN